MRLFFLAAAGAAALLTSACDTRTEGEISTIHTSNDGEGKFLAVSNLECPDREGDLRLASKDAAGRSCFYRTRHGGEVELRLAALEGADAETTLKTLQEQLRPLVPAAVSPPEPPPSPEPASSQREESHVDIAGVIDVRSRGDEATIKLPGVSIQADDGSAKIRVKDKGENVTIDAHDGGATIRSDGGGKHGDVRSTYLLASETPGPSGVRLAGYAARGPAVGPLVIGVVKATSEKDDDVFDDMEDLVKRNTKRR